MTYFTYISFTRFPSEKAHSLYMAKVCDSFGKFKIKTTLIVPRRIGTLKENPYTYYKVEQVFSIVQIACIDLLWFPFFKSLWHKVGLLTFAIGVYVKVFFGNRKTYYFTNDVFIALILSLLSKRVIYELHDYPIKISWLYRTVGKRVYKILTNNIQKVSRVVVDFDIPEHKVFAVHNGVSLEDFDIELSKEDARTKLGLDINKKYVVYTGHLYEWKGVDTLAKSATLTPDLTILFVGGTNSDISRMKKKYISTPNIIFCGHQPPSKIPIYLKAADVLVVPNTGKKDISRLHTSPIKIFEYMASKRPIVASDLPSIREILTEKEATFFISDSTESLTDSILRSIVLEDNITQASYKKVKKFTWNNRMQIIYNNVLQ